MKRELLGPKSEKQRQFLASDADITIFGGENIAPPSFN